MTFQWQPKNTKLQDELQSKQGESWATQQVEDYPWWQDALRSVGSAFSWLGEHVEKPFASIVTSPFTPSTKGTEGMSWLERERAEYDVWEAPTLHTGIDLPSWLGGEELTFGVKGAAEMAPWFVVPAAAKGLGAVAKGITGVSGTLGKIAETPGGIIGRAISGGGESLVGANAVVDKFMKIAPRLKLGGKVQKVMYSLEKSPKIEQYMNKFVSGATIEERQSAKVALSGALKRVGLSDDDLKAFMKTIQPEVEKGVDKYVKINNQIMKYLGDNPTPLGTITVPDIETLGTVVKDLASSNKIGFSDAISANNGLANLKAYLFDPSMGIKPIPSEIKTLSKVFGENFGEALADMTTSTGGKTFNAIIDLMNFPRAVLASFDFSGILRQGGVLFARHPIIGLRAAKTTIQTTFSQKAADIVPKLIKDNKLYEQGLIDGMELLEVGSRTMAQEPFMSRLASKIPFVKMSERGYTSGLNKLAWDSYYDMYPKFIKMGATAADTQGLAKLVMASVGRGTLPKVLKNAGGLLNSFFFAPRLIMSRLQLPTMLFSKSAFVRAEARKTLGSFLGAGTGILGLAKLGGAEIELDPRSADFGKIKIGNTRLDIWTGYTQYARLLAQLVTSQSKNEAGTFSTVSRSTVLGRFLQSKTSPAMGLIVDLLKGQTYMGEDMIPKDSAELLEQLKNRIMPLFLQDMLDAYSQDGAKGIGLALPGIAGVGVTTYMNDVKKIQDKLAKEKGADSWDDFGLKYGDKAQLELGKSSPELEAAYEKQEESYLGTASARYREEGQSIEQMYQDKITLASKEFSLKGDGQLFRDKVESAGTSRRDMYEARNKQSDYKEIVAKYNKPLTPEDYKTMNPLDIAKHDYEQMMYSDDMTDQFGNYNFDEAERRKELFVQMYGQDALKYVEEYRGMKWDAPTAFKELENARKILQPYWNVIDQVQQMGIDPESKFGQKLVTRMRKNMKLSNPLILKYYNLFYSQNQT